MSLFGIGLLDRDELDIFKNQRKNLQTHHFELNQRTQVSSRNMKKHGTVKISLAKIWLKSPEDHWNVAIPYMSIFLF